MPHVKNVNIPENKLAHLLLNITENTDFGKQIQHEIKKSILDDKKNLVLKNSL